MDPGHGIKGCTEWSLCKVGGGPESCSTWGAESFEALDVLRDYLIKNKADIAKRKAAGKTYIACEQMDNSLRCNLGFMVKECTAPKGGHCGVVLQSHDNTATCSASNGAKCIAKMRLRSEDLNSFNEQFKMATQD